MININPSTDSMPQRAQGVVFAGKRKRSEYMGTIVSDSPNDTAGLGASYNRHLCRQGHMPGNFGMRNDIENISMTSPSPKKQFYMSPVNPVILPLRMPSQNASRNRGQSETTAGDGGSVINTPASSNASDSVPVIPICLVLPGHLVGFLIGRNGAAIREIETTTGASVRFERQADMRPSQEKVVAITGEHEKKMQAIELLLQRLKIVSNPSNQTPTNAADSDDALRYITILVPKKSIPMIVGLKGLTISDISKKSGCQISVQKHGLEGDEQRPVSIFSARGIPNLIHGIKLISRLLEDFTRQGRLIGDEFFKFNAGVREGRSPAVVSQVDAVYDGMGAIHGGPISIVNPINQLSQVSPSGYQSSGPGVPIADVSTHGRGVMTNNLLEHPLSTQFSRCTIRFAINPIAAAWVVGKNGNHVKEIKRTTGAEIQISDEHHGFDCMSKKDRLLSFTGDILSKYKAINALVGPMQSKASQSNEPLRMVIPYKAVSCIIGPKGSIINHISRTTSTDIHIDKQGAADENKVIKISGKPSAQLMACISIVQRLEELENPEIAREGLRIPINDFYNTHVNMPGVHQSPTANSVSLPLTEVGMMQSVNQVSVPAKPIVRYQNEYPYSSTPANHQFSSHTQNYDYRRDSTTAIENVFISSMQGQIPSEVLTTTAQFVLELFFPQMQLDILLSIGESGKAILDEISDRSSCSIAIGVSGHSNHRCLTLNGAPVANAVALLLIQEKFLEFGARNSLSSMQYGSVKLY